MSSRYKLFAILAAVLVAGAAIAAVLMNGGADGGDDEPSAILDMAGRDVTAVADMDVERLIATGPGALRFVSYLNCSDLVVAVEPREGPAYNAKSYMYAYGYDDTSRYDRSIGSGGDGLIEYPEQLLMLENVPQVIIYSVPSASLTSQQLAYIETAESLGMRVVVILELDTMLDGTGSLSEAFVKQTTLLGKVLDREERAAELLTFIEATLGDLRARAASVSASEREATAYIGSLSYAGAKGFDHSSSWYDPFAILGVNNVVTGGSQVVYQINMESILGAQPDYVFLDPTGYSTFIANWNDGASAQSREALMALTAFQEGRVFMTIPFIWYGVNFDNVLLGAYHIGTVMYPSAFGDVDLKEKASEIYTAFVGEDCYEDMNAWFIENRGTPIAGAAPL